MRVDVLSLAAVKRAVDFLRAHGHDRHLLGAVMRLLRDRAVLGDDAIREGFEDLAAGRVVPVTDELLGGARGRLAGEEPIQVEQWSGFEFDTAPGSVLVSL